MRLFLSNVLIVFLIAQVVGPSLSNMIEELEAGQNMFSVHIFAEYLLKLGIASTYIWLLVFYGFFHVLLNLLAEILMFGDRVYVYVCRVACGSHSFPSLQWVINVWMGF